MTPLDRTIAKLGLISSSVALLGLLAVVVTERRLGESAWPVVFLTFTTLATGGICGRRTWGCYLGIIALMPILLLPFLIGTSITKNWGSDNVGLGFVIVFGLLPSVMLACVCVVMIVWLIRLKRRLTDPVRPTKQT